MKYVAEKSEASKDFNHSYLSVDPAPAHEESDVKKLQLILNDQKLTLFDRYRAMFKLRDIGSEEAIQALVSGFADESPVLRHEIAYVMGQIQHPAAIPALKKVLAEMEEHSMV
jgi:deoxyhypusine monooxygenase